jgi:ribosomal protein S18 acetylase RimI-like enzyme
MEIVPLSERWRPWALDLIAREWGSWDIISRGRVHAVETLPGFVAERADKALGLATYHIEADQCELVSLNSLEERRGIGGALIEAVKRAASDAGCRRLWLVTTNDNLPALGFYQKHGFRLVAVHPEALEASRRLMPEIPRLGREGIPLRDELELEMTLDS